MRRPIRIGSAALPYPGEDVSGDAWVAHWLDPDVCRVAVIDGAGHGPPAEHAARLAIEVLASHTELELEPALAACHRALHGTRGAVMTIARIDLRAGVIRAAGVGNIGMFLQAGGREQHFVAQRGMLGSNIPSIRPVDFSVGESWLLALYTDGVRSHLSVEHAAGTVLEDPTPLAEAILERYRRAHDDSLVVIVTCP